jgi:hypothetical protein
MEPANSVEKDTVDLSNHSNWSGPHEDTKGTTTYMYGTHRIRHPSASLGKSRCPHFIGVIYNYLCQSVCLCVCELIMLWTSINDNYV